MIKTIVIVASGPNNLQIPCEVMRSIGDARRFCEEDLGLEAANKSRMIYYLPKDASEENTAREYINKVFAPYYENCSSSHSVISNTYAFIITEVAYNRITDHLHKQ